MTTLDNDKPVSENLKDDLDLSKDTLEDLDVSEETSEEARGGTGTRTKSHPCG
jgi:hypothetical protein